MSLSWPFSGNFIILGINHTPFLLAGLMVLYLGGLWKCVFHLVTKNLCPNTTFTQVTFPQLITHKWSDNKVHELIAVKVLHTSLLNTIVVAFKIFPLGSYTPMSAPSPPFKTILELVLWNGLQSCRCITPDMSSMPSFQYFLYFWEQKKVTWG